MPKIMKLLATPSVGQADAQRCGKDSKNREERLCYKKPAKKLSEVFVDELVEEEAEGKNDGASDDPIDVAPKHQLLMEKRAEG